MIYFCPYPDCNIPIEIIEINCPIFRCGIYKNTDNYGNKKIIIYQKKIVTQLNSMIKYGDVVDHLN